MTEIMLVTCMIQTCLSVSVLWKRHMIQRNKSTPLPHTTASLRISPLATVGACPHTRTHTERMTFRMWKNLSIHYLSGCCVLSQFVTASLWAAQSLTLVCALEGANLSRFVFMLSLWLFYVVHAVIKKINGDLFFICPAVLLAVSPLDVWIFGPV